MRYVKRIEDYPEWTKLQCILSSLEANDLSQACMEADVRLERVPSKSNARVLLSMITRTLWVIDDWYHTNTNLVAQYIKETHGANMPSMSRISLRIKKISDDINQLTKESRVQGISMQTSSMLQETIIGLQANLETLMEQYENLAQCVYLPNDVHMHYEKACAETERAENQKTWIAKQYEPRARSDAGTFNPKKPNAITSVGAQIAALYEDIMTGQPAREWREFLKNLQASLDAR